MIYEGFQARYCSEDVLGVNGARTSRRSQLACVMGHALETWKSWPVPSVPLLRHPTSHAKRLGGNPHRTISEQP